DLADVGALADLAFLTDDSAEPLELVGHAAVELDDLVELVGDLAVEAFEVDGEAGGEVALAEGGQGGEELGAVELVAGLVLAARGGQQGFNGRLAGEHV